MAEILPELIEMLEWFIENDETNDSSGNAFFIEGLERARKLVAVAKGQEYVRGDWIIDRSDVQE